MEKKKTKAKKLTVKQVKALKAGINNCVETKCAGQTCGGMESYLWCGKSPTGGTETISVAQSAKTSGKIKG